MQRGVGDRDTAHKHRSQLGHGREFARAAYLHVNGQHGGHLFLRRVFVGHGPARLTGHKAQAGLQHQVVDLVNHAVDVIGQGVTLGRDALVKSHEACRALHTRRLLGHRKAPGLELHQHVVMAGPLRATFGGWGDVAQPVGKKAQGALGGNARIELAHRASGGIAGVDKGLLALGACSDALALALIQRLKVIPAHIDLAAHFQHSGRIGRQTQRDLANGADVGGDLFARFAVTPGGGLHQHTALVAQAHGQAVKFQFAHIGHGRVGIAQAQLFADAGVKSLGPAGFGVGFGADAEHGHAVRDLRKSVQHRPAHPLGGRVGRQQFGVGRLQSLQLAKQAVVFGIGDFGRVERVVGVRVVVQKRSQLFGFVGGRGRWGAARDHADLGGWQVAKQVRMGHGLQLTVQENKRRA